MVEFKVELANKIRGGRAVGNLWGVGKYVDGRRHGYALTPQESEERAREVARAMNAHENPLSSGLGVVAAVAAVGGLAAAICYFTRPRTGSGTNPSPQTYAVNITASGTGAPLSLHVGDIVSVTVPTPGTSTILPASVFGFGGVTMSAPGGGSTTPYQAMSIGSATYQFASSDGTISFAQQVVVTEGTTAGVPVTIGSPVWNGALGTWCYYDPNGALVCHEDIPKPKPKHNVAGLPDGSLGATPAEFAALVNATQRLIQASASLCAFRFLAYYDPVLVFQRAWNNVYGGYYGMINEDAGYDRNTTLAAWYVASQNGLGPVPGHCPQYANTPITIHPPGYGVTLFYPSQGPEQRPGMGPHAPGRPGGRVAGAELAGVPQGLGAAPVEVGTLGYDGTNATYTATSRGLQPLVRSILVSPSNAAPFHAVQVYAVGGPTSALGDGNEGWIYPPGACAGQVCRFLGKTAAGGWAYYELRWNGMRITPGQPTPLGFVDYVGAAQVPRPAPPHVPQPHV